MADFFLPGFGYIEYERKLKIFSAIKEMTETFREKIESKLTYCKQHLFVACFWLFMVLFCFTFCCAMDDELQRRKTMDFVFREMKKQMEANIATFKG